jgi:preprotein translocase subunit SecA
VLKYDDVLNIQRQVIYEQRREVLEGKDLSADVRGWIDETIDRIVFEYTDTEYAEDWDIDGLVTAMNALLGTDLTVDELREDLPDFSRDALSEDFKETAHEEYDEREKDWGEELARDVERFVILQVVDTRWREHLDNMDYLREGVHLRAMAQKDPLTEYRAEGHTMFEQLSLGIHEEVVSLLFHAQVEPRTADDLRELQDAQASDGGEALSYEHQSLAGSEAIAAAGTGGVATAVATPVGSGGGAVATQQRVVADRDKIGRNDPCWCGSGKKYKKCHGR